jgi:Tol biopolymer transport system component
MGEVYRARDPRLGREVAIKVVLGAETPGAARLRRFEDEARAVAALSHPNVLTVHDVGAHEGRPFLVLELLEGETLRERLERGPLPASRAGEVASEVCRGLEAAHARGLVHRDLKPENIFLTGDGRVKILDFGVAKLTRGEADSGLPGPAPPDEKDTRTAPGTILGTIGYLSPEQARGRGAEARSDLFALGAVLYEMLSGRPAFSGETPADTLAAVLEHDPPPVTTATSRIPRGLARVVRRCLAKDPEERFRSAHDLALALEAVQDQSPVSFDWPSRRAGTWAGGALALAVGALAWWTVADREHPPPAEPMSVTPFTTDGGEKATPRLSPDAERVAYTWDGAAVGNRDIYVKALGLGAEPLRLTTDPATDLAPVWSPDGRQIAFMRWPRGPAVFYTVPSSGGRERKLIDIVGAVTAFGGEYIISSLSWSPDGEWMALAEKVHEDRPARIVRLSLKTLEKRPLTSPPASSFGDRLPALSPDGSLLAFVRSGTRGWGHLDVWVQPVDGEEARQLTFGQYEWCRGLAWTPDGRSIVFTVTDNGWILRVNLAGGPPRPVVGTGPNAANATIRGSRMVYEQRVREPMQIWRAPGRKGLPGREPEAVVVSSRNDTMLSVSPDGRKIAFVSDRSGSPNVWTCDPDGANPVQLTDLGEAKAPRWSPDGRRLVFHSTDEGASDLYVIDAEGGAPRRLTQEASYDDLASWSRDGRWIYFRSDRSGEEQIWKIAPEGGPAVQVTRDGGAFALESWDGRDLYYVNSERLLWKIPVGGGEATSVVPDRVNWWDWAPSPSGVYYATGTYGKDFAVSFLDGETGEVTEVFRREGPFWHGSLAVSPDEEWILFGEAPARQSELMLVENYGQITPR